MTCDKIHAFHICIIPVFVSPPAQQIHLCRITCTVLKIHAKFELVGHAIQLALVLPVILACVHDYVFQLSKLSRYLNCWLPKQSGVAEHLSILREGMAPLHHECNCRLFILEQPPALSFTTVSCPPLALQPRQFLLSIGPY